MKVYGQTNVRKTFYISLKKDYRIQNTEKDLVKKSVFFVTLNKAIDVMFA